MEPLPIGTRFGRLIVIGHDNASRRHETCRCDCGRIRRVDRYCLLTGETRSCNCLRTEMHRQRLLTHGETRRNQPRRIPVEHETWSKIKSRCFNVNNRQFHAYGGRGITMCERWRTSYVAFLADMGRRPPGCTSIDRYPDNNGHYEPGNCRWATQTQQANNTRTNIVVSVNGIDMTLAECARLHGMNASNLRSRYHRHHRDIDAALASERYPRKKV